MPKIEFLEKNSGEGEEKTSSRKTTNMSIAGPLIDYDVEERL